MKYKITSKRGTLLFANSIDLKRHESVLRGLKEDYSIEYPDGYKMNCEYIK